MTIYRLSLAVVLALVTTTVHSNDLASIERRLTKEPSYVGQPYYLLLVFGPNAERQAWIVVDGETLYVDRNGDGDLTGPDERVELDVEATRKVNLAPGSGLTGMNVFELGEVAGVRLRFEFWVRKEGHNEKHELLRQFQEERKANGWETASLMRIADDGSEAQNPVILCRQPQDAQITHFDGPLTFKLAYDEARTGKKQTLKWPRAGVFAVNIGTPGIPAKNCRYSIFSPLTITEIPSDLHPVARFEFKNKTPGKPHVRLDIALNKRCCGDTYYGWINSPVYNLLGTKFIPKDAGEDPVSITVEFPAWPKGHVAPATFKVPIK